MKFLILLFISFYFTHTFAQSSYIPLNDKEYHHLVERIEISQSRTIPFLHTAIKPYERKVIAAMADTVLQDSTKKLSKGDKFNLAYISLDNSEWSKRDSTLSKKSFLKYFYTNNADFFSINTKDFDLHVNPVFSFSVGKETNNKNLLYLNTRGIEIRGMINRKIGFYTFFTENQAILPSYVQNFQNFATVPGVPSEGYTKNLKNNSVDFITARGYFTFNIIKNIQFQFGHDKNFIGNGYRSLLLSDFSSNYTFLKLNTKVWKISYQNIFAEMIADVFYLNKLYPKKYFALHHLSLHVNKNIEIGLFESVIFGRCDSTKHGQFDFNYLNPIIFYRSIEQQLGSEDNALLGMDLKINLLRRFTFYGQLILDEFLLKQVKADSGWSGNKQAGQLGLKYFNIANISTLDLQLEANIVRPYNYSHKDKYRSYTNFNQPLAHPLGANFKEFIIVLRYQPLKRVRTTAKLFIIKYGSDTSFIKTKNDNAGGNIFKSYETANSAYNNFIGQGIPNSLNYASLNISYQIKHNLFIDFSYISRRLESELEKNNSNNSYFMTGIRYNVAQRINEF